jgi:hypothetical protein
MKRKVTVTSRESLARIGNAVRSIENGGRNASHHSPRYMAWDGGGTVSLGKTSADWLKDTSASIPLYAGTPGAEAATGESVSVWNHFGKVMADKWVMIGENSDGNRYLIAPEADQQQLVYTVEIVATTTAGVTTSKLVFRRKKVWVHSIEEGTTVELGLAECVPGYSG